MGMECSECERDLRGGHEPDCSRAAPTVKPLELVVGRTYRAKKPAPAGGYPALVNDRTIIWIGLTEVQYDGPAVLNGRRYPKVDKEKFIAWAHRDVTDELPPGEYATWPTQANSHGAGVSNAD